MVEIKILVTEGYSSGVYEDMMMRLTWKYGYRQCRIQECLVRHVYRTIKYRKQDGRAEQRVERGQEMKVTLHRFGCYLVLFTGAIHQ